MFGMKSKDDHYVVVQTQPGEEPYASKPHDREAAMRIFDGTLNAAQGAFRPDRALKVRVMSAEEWTRLQAAQIVESLLES